MLFGGQEGGHRKEEKQRASERVRKCKRVKRNRENKGSTLFVSMGLVMEARGHRGLVDWPLGSKDDSRLVKELGCSSFGDFVRGQGLAYATSKECRTCRSETQGESSVWKVWGISVFRADAPVHTWIAPHTKCSVNVLVLYEWKMVYSLQQLELVLVL